MSLPLRKAGKLSLRELCLLSLIGAFMLASQIAMSGLPNIHIVATLILVCGACFGWKALYAVLVFVLLEALVWGFGFWVISYFYLWPMLVVAAVILRKQETTLLWAIAAGIHGLLFGAGCSIPYLFVGGWEMAFSYWISGIPFDLVHCGGNFVMTLVLFRPLRSVMLRGMGSRGNLAGG